MLPPPMAMRQVGSWVGSARGSGLNSSCADWSSTTDRPIVASSGAMRGTLRSGRRPPRSITAPSSPQPAATVTKVTGSGRASFVTHSQPM